MRDVNEVEKIVYDLLVELEVPFPEQAPRAIAETLLLYTKGYAKPKLKRIFPITFKAPRNAQIIKIDDIKFYTLCEHHMLPFFGTVSIRYVPDKKIIGLSKPKRLIYHLSHRFQIQERFTEEILDELWKIIKPVALSVKVTARHLCAEMREARAEGELVTTVTKKFKNALAKEIWEVRI